ncbi:MAG: hypothetical protein CME63_03570 [Halobacteriovoraceae bacterium]|nr:hypothetical protein [Halobacteriovoraceae bacterium]|tara:strand:- start:95466 stop:96473 length:1008 start_codon:yes stop_codon:yes gene_type:complete
MNKEAIISGFSSYLSLYRKAFDLFNRKKTTLLAASASFYVILTIVPFFLLLIRIVGSLIGDLKQVNQLIFKLGNEVFPNLGPEILLKAQEIIQATLLANSNLTFINFIILTISALSFFNTIWSGIFLISDDKSFLKWWKHLKGLGVIALTVVMLVVAFAFHPMLLLLIKSLKYNLVVDIIYEQVGVARSLIDYLRSINVEKSALFKENLFHFLIFLSYFTFIYRWFFNWKISLKDSLMSSATFVGLLLIGKNLFWVYFFYVRETLMSSYGDYYTFIVAIIWIYLVMCFFFFGVSLSVVLRDRRVNKKRRRKEALSQQSQADWDFPNENFHENSEK